jgi:hypothetical protein
MNTGLFFGPNESDLFYGFDKQKLWPIFLQEKKLLNFFISLEPSVLYTNFVR